MDYRVELFHPLTKQWQSAIVHDALDGDDAAAKASALYADEQWHVKGVMPVSTDDGNSDVGVAPPQGVESATPACANAA
jgi:hypothetical protein